jgi:hypothetical protein
VDEATVMAVDIEVVDIAVAAVIVVDIAVVVTVRCVLLYGPSSPSIREWNLPQLLTFENVLESQNH